MGKYETHTLTDGQFQFKLKSGDGQIILISKAYKTKTDCKTGINSIRKIVKYDKLFIRLESKTGKAYFNFTAVDGKILAVSEMYENRDSMENAIDSVKKNAPRSKL